MIDPIRSRNRVAVVVLTSLAVFVPALVMPRTAEELAVRKMILFDSLAVLLISAVWLAVRWDEARRLTRLRSGVGVVARWTVDPARWEWFRGLSSEWDRRVGVQPNDARLAQDPGTAGIELVVTRDGILIGTDFWPLERDVRITVHADWIEFNQVIPKASGTALRTVLRLPLERGREQAAADVDAAYRSAIVAARSGPHQLIYVVLICFVGIPAVTALGWFLARITGWIM
jgi:hypothetical protein